MALKIRGESEFTVSTTRDPSEVLAVARLVLDDFERDHESVLSTNVSLENGYEFQIELVLRASSYAEAEGVMSKILSGLTEALTDTASMTTVEGATELVPA